MNKMESKLYYIPLDKIISGKISIMEHANKKLLYNDLSDLYEAVIDRDTNREVNFINYIIKKYNHDSKKILDLGCGVGRHLRELCKKGYDVSGVDLSKKMIEKSKKNVPNGVFYNVDFRDYNLGVKFDVIMCMWSTFNYLIDKKEMNQYFNKLCEHLENEGIFILDIWNCEGDHFNCYKKEFDDHNHHIDQYIFKKIIDKYCESLYFYIIKYKIKNKLLFALDQEINIGYKEDEIKKVTKKYLTHVKSYGDYEDIDYDPKNSERLIMVFKKGSDAK